MQTIDRAERPFDFALLDINLGPDTSYDIARRLREQGVPFAFASGYGDSARLPDDLSDAINVGKPYDTDAIKSLLAKVMVQA